jgi:hypothetical protein
MFEFRVIESREMVPGLNQYKPAITSYSEIDASDCFVSGWQKRAILSNLLGMTSGKPKGAVKKSSLEL